MSLTSRLYILRIRKLFHSLAHTVWDRTGEMWNRSAQSCSYDYHFFPVHLRKIEFIVELVDNLIWNPIEASLCWMLIASVRICYEFFIAFFLFKKLITLYYWFNSDDMHCQGYGWQCVLYETNARLTCSRLNLIKKSI